MLSQLLPILFMAVLSALFGAGVLFGISKIGPKIKASKMKLDAIESGVLGEQTSTTKYPVKFYLTAILFILFDIEAIFIYPWAIIYKEYLKTSMGTFVFVEMLVFMLTLIWGLFYVWKSNALDWE